MPWISPVQFFTTQPVRKSKREGNEQLLRTWFLYHGVITDVYHRIITWLSQLYHGVITMFITGLSWFYHGIITSLWQDYHMVIAGLSHGCHMLDYHLQARTPMSFQPSLHSNLPIQQHLDELQPKKKNTHTHSELAPRTKQLPKLTTKFNNYLRLRRNGDLKIRSQARKQSNRSLQCLWKN